MADIGLERAILVFTGAHNTGKTLAALTYLPPSRVGEVYYHDCEGSGSRFVEQLKGKGRALGHYLNLDDRWSEDTDLPGTADLLKRISVGKLPWVDNAEKDSLVAFWKWYIDYLDKTLIQDEYSVYVLDPVRRIESAMRAYVDANKRETGWKRKGYGEFWRKGFYPLYRGLFSAIFDRGVDVIILTAHLGNPWTDEGPVPGKVEPKAKPELYLLSQFYGWLVQEPKNAQGAPACVVIKERLGTTDIDEGSDSWDIVRRLPRRIPRFTWDEVERYLSEGCDLSDPAPGEVPSDEEQSMIDNSLTKAQQQLMLLRAQAKVYEEKARVAGAGVPMGDETFSISDTDTDDDTPSQEEKALMLAEAGMGADEIAEELSAPRVLVEDWLSQ